MRKTTLGTRLQAFRARLFRGLALSKPGFEDFGHGMPLWRQGRSLPCCRDAAFVRGLWGWTWTNVFATKQVACACVAAGHDLFTDAAFTHNTLEFNRITARLLELGVETITNHNISAVAQDHVSLVHVHSASQSSLPAASIVMVTARTPNDGLYLALRAQPEALATAGIKSVTAIGDCYAPSAIVHAVYAGHRFAQELDVPQAERLFRRDRPVVEPRLEI